LFVTGPPHSQNVHQGDSRRLLCVTLLRAYSRRRSPANDLGRRVAEGVRVCPQNDEGQLKLDRFGESLAEMEVEISEDVFLLKAATPRSCWSSTDRTSRISRHPSR